MEGSIANIKMLYFVGQGLELGFVGICYRVEYGKLELVKVSKGKLMLHSVLYFLFKITECELEIIACSIS